MIRRLNALRWRLAGLIAPDKIVAAPSGDEEAFLFIRDGRVSWWIAAETLELKMSESIQPFAPALVPYGLVGPRGTFSGTIGRPN